VKSTLKNVISYLLLGTSIWRPCLMFQILKSRMLSELLAGPAKSCWWVFGFLV